VNARANAYPVSVPAGWSARQSRLAAGEVAHAAQADLGTVARRVPAHGLLRVEGVPFEGRSAALNLERFEAFAPDAQIIVAYDDGDRIVPPPDNAYYRGTVEGDETAVAVLTARARGGVRGLIVKDGVPWILDEERGPTRRPGLHTRRVDSGREFASRPFRCDADGAALSSAPPVGNAERLDSGLAAAELPVAATTVNYTARVAVETDYEFFQLFGNVTDATDYVADLFAYASTTYEAEVNTNFVVSSLKLWATSSDPWTTTTCSDLLSEFRTYWGQNNGGVSRTVAHMLSGKRLGCGIAFLGVLCNDSYGYGVSASMTGNFDIQNPGLVWDLLAVSHEIGHNFNSPHTHCYGGIGGNAAPVDQCYGSEGGCYAGPTSLPCSLSPGGGCGTIMSYCHLLGGGYGNITLTFGLGFPYGVYPDRVPNRMHDHVAQRAQYYPTCLSPILPTPTPTSADIATPTPTPTRTPTVRPTNTPTLTATRTPTPTRTPTQTPTSTATVTPTNTPSRTPTSSPSRTPTSSPTGTPTNTPSVTATPTPTRTATNSPTPTPSDTPTATFTPTATQTLTETPTVTPTNTPSVTPTAPPPATPTATLTAQCVRCGDVTGDGNVDIVDALFISQHTVLLRPSVPCPELGDVNGNGQLDIVDGLFISQYTVNLRTELTCATPTATATPSPTAPPG